MIVRHSRYGLRIPVDGPIDRVEALARWTRLTASPETGERVRCLPDGSISLRPEPPWLWASVFPSLLCASGLAELVSSRGAHPLVVHGAAAVMAGAGTLAATWGARDALVETIVRRQDSRCLVLASKVGPWSARVTTVAFDRLVAVLCVGEPPARTVLLAGPRNEQLGVVYRERTLDPANKTLAITELIAAYVAWVQASPLMDV